MPPDATWMTQESGEARCNAGIKSSVKAYTLATFTAKFFSKLHISHHHHQKRNRHLPSFKLPFKFSWKCQSLASSYPSTVWVRSFSISPALFTCTSQSKITNRTIQISILSSVILQNARKKVCIRTSVHEQYQNVKRLFCRYILGGEVFDLLQWC